MKYFTRMAAILVAVLLIMSMAGCAGEPKTDAAMPDTTNDNYRVFYEIFVGSFSDSNGDGIGDLRGIINRMDYLNDGNVNSDKSLGVQGIWLSPIFKSSSYHKYDVDNYYTIDEKFGTEEDLKELLELCHERNVKVILDLVLNHTSKNNLAFSKFRNAHADNDTASEYYNYYTHCKGSERKSGCTYAPIPGCTDEYYECNFSPDMPELNYDNQLVREKTLEIAKYYLDLGVDGFRFDAIKYVYYGETNRNVEFWQWYMEELRAYKPDIYCVGECWSGDTEVLSYYPAMNCFNFGASQAEGAIAMAAKGMDINNYTGYVCNYLKTMEAKNPDGMMINFVSNHDMDRAAGYLRLATHYAQMGANLYLLGPGSPFIYYGEEIGLKGTRGSSNTDANRRLAMLWGDEDTVKNPTGSTYAASKQTNGTVASQLEDENSLLRYYCRLISMRIRYPEIARGDYTAVNLGSTQCGGFSISYEGATIGVLHNVGEGDAFTVDLAQAGLPFTQLCEVIGQSEAKLDGTTLTIGPQTSVILK